jgi:molybdopterin-guanine dinucleotide biosynthesis protein A
MGGGDKALIEINGITILDRVLATLSAQCLRIVINANGDPKRFDDTGLPVIPDNVAGHPGPLAGVLAGLDWLAAENLGIEWIVSVPGDCPFLPDDLACARSGKWRHPVVGLWPVALREDLRKALVEEDLRKIEVWTARHGVAIADWPAEPVDPFLNVNTPEDLVRAEQVAGAV